MATLPPLQPPRPQVDLVDGAWQEPAVTLGSLADPNTGAVLAPQLATASDQVERALAAADALHRSGALATLSIDVRAAVLQDIAAGLTLRAADLAYEDAMSTGNAARPAAPEGGRGQAEHPDRLGPGEQLVRVGGRRNVTDGPWLGGWGHPSHLAEQFQDPVPCHVGQAVSAGGHPRVDAG